MDGIEGVMDVEEQEFEPGTDSTETQETTTQTGETGSESQTGESTEKAEGEYSPKLGREFSQWLKGLRDANPNDPNVAKFARMAKDAYSRQYALNQLDPKGLDGIRERYAIMDSVIHNDPERGELKGAEAISAMQDSIRDIADIDEKIASGDVTALESFGDDMKAGIVKMAPAILDLARQMDPEGYSAALLPHFVQTLAGSPLVQNYNAMVDVLNEQMPAWLPDDKKQAWADDKMKRIMGMAGNMGTWLNEQAAKAGKGPQSTQQVGKDGRKVDPLAERERQFNEREQQQHWNTNISPKLDQHAGTRFSELFKPYAKRLHLDGATTNALKMEFSKRVSAESAKDQQYMSQIKRYHAMRNPDSGTVLNYAKVQFDKHAKTVMDSLVNERYKPFLSGKPTTQQTTQTQQNRTSPVSGMQFVSVKPARDQIDYRGTTSEMIFKDQYRLKSGKIVQVRT